MTLLLAGVGALATSCKDKPTAEDQTQAEKRKEVVESSAGAVSDDGGEHAAGIRKFFDDFGRATAAGDSRKVAELLDWRMFLSLLKQQGLVPARMLRDEDRLVKMLRARLVARLLAPVGGVRWRRQEIRRVRFIRVGTEAVVYTRHWDEDDESSKMRWWLFCKDGTWRAYDLEFLELSMRVSTGMGMGMKMADGDDPSAKSLPALMQAIQKVAAGQTEAALGDLQGLEGVKFPAFLESLRLMLIAGLLSDGMEYARALRAADRALAHNSDLPLIHLIYAECHNGLKQHDKAIEAAERHAEFLGKDASYYEAVGNAHRGMGKTAEAIEAHKKGLADDPLSGDNVLGLMRALPAGQRDTVVKHYKGLRDVDEWFVGMADRLVQERDARALQVLIGIHRGIMPDDENIAVYEKELAALKQRN